MTIVNMNVASRTFRTLMIKSRNHHSLSTCMSKHIKFFDELLIMFNCFSKFKKVLQRYFSQISFSCHSNLNLGIIDTWYWYSESKMRYIYFDVSSFHSWLCLYDTLKSPWIVSWSVEVILLLLLRPVMIRATCCRCSVIVTWPIWHYCRRAQKSLMVLFILLCLF